MARISVIIPCYNAEKYIEKCLTALCRQTYQDFEVIIVDDRSTDASVEAVKGLMQRLPLKIRLLENETNMGPARSRNRGVEASASEYVTFCDSDDWYDDTFLEVLYRAAQTKKCDMVCCGYKIVDDQGSVARSVLPSTEAYEQTKNQLLIDIDSLCVTMIRRELMIRIKIPDLRNGEDMAVMPCLLHAAARVAVEQQCLYHYRRNAQSASSAADARVVDELTKSFLYLYDTVHTVDAQACEYICTRNYLYGALITLFDYTFDIPRAKQLIQLFEARYPRWYENAYVHLLPKYKRLVLLLIRHRMYFMLYLIAQLRKKLTRG